MTAYPAQRAARFFVTAMMAFATAATIVAIYAYAKTPTVDSITVHSDGVPRFEIKALYLFIPTIGLWVIAYMISAIVRAASRPKQFVEQNTDSSFQPEDARTLLSLLYYFGVPSLLGIGAFIFYLVISNAVTVMSQI